MSNFNYCPLAWHSCGKTNNQKLEKLQERSLRILYWDYISHFQGLLEDTSSKSFLTTRIECIQVEVFKSLNKLNAPCLHDMFKNNDTPYDVRATKLEQPLRRTTNYGLRTFSYIGSRLWNLLVQEYPEVPHMDFGTIQVTSETVDWSQMWRFWNAFTLGVLHDVIIYDLHAWYIYVCIYLYICMHMYIYIYVYIRIHIYLIVHFETCTVYMLHPYL